MTTLDEYRRELGWSWSRLAREAKLDIGTVYRARDGEAIRGETANKLAEALSRGLRHEIRFQDIKGLNVGV